MLKFYASSCLVLLLFLSSNAEAITQNTPIVACNYCQTQTDFNNAALNARLSQDTNGYYEYLVINMTTSVLYDITTIKYQQYNVKSITSSALATSDIVSAYNFWIPYFQAAGTGSPAQFALMSNGGYGEASFYLSDQGSICTAFNGSLGFVAMAAEMNSSLGKLIEGSLNQFFGHGPEAAFVFANADVATYYIYPDDMGVYSCKYVPGTARDAYGKFINDRGLGGNGTSNGSNYVTGKSPNELEINLSDYTETCAWVQHEDGSLTLIGCETN